MVPEYSAPRRQSPLLAYATITGMAIEITHFTDPGCPWAYSASPALAALDFRYGEQLTWRLVTIGLTERAQQYVDRGYTPTRAVASQRHFARFGMPFSHELKPAVAATARMCRAIVATRLAAPELEYAAFRALQFGQFTTPLVMDDDASIRTVLGTVPGLDADAIVAALDSEAVTAGYEADRAQARTAEGGATHFQGKHAASDGPVRYTAPSLLMRATASDAALEAGGFQSLQVYDMAIANLDRTLKRRPAPEDPLEAVAAFEHGVTTAEVTAIMTADLGVPDPVAVEAALIGHAGAGRVTRRPLGDDALWQAAA
jgi:2-hydroxychromene-2-carboxylate isomerase